MDGDCDGLCLGASSRFRVRFLARCMVKIVLFLESSSGLNVRRCAILRFSVFVRCG